MAETNDRFFLHPRELLAASEINFLDAINLVVYATLPLKTSLRGSSLIAGYMYRDGNGDITQTQWLPEKDDLIRKYAEYIDGLVYPVAPGHYEPLLDKMCRAKESVLPYFFHEHHMMVDRRRRAAMFARLYKKRQEEIAKKNARTENLESEKESTLPQATSFTSSELQSYLRTQGVAQWWKDESNLASHTHLERVVLSDSLSLPEARSPGWGADEMQRLSDNLHQGMETQSPAIVVEVRQGNQQSPEHESYDDTQLPSLLLAEKLLKQSFFAGVNLKLLQEFGARHETFPLYGWTGYPAWNQAFPVQEPQAVATSQQIGLISDGDHRIRNERDDIPAPAREEQRAAATRDVLVVKSHSESEDTASTGTTPLEPADPKHLSKKEVADLLGVSENTVDNYRKKFSDFPEPFFLGATTLRWKKGQILDWMDSRPRSRL